jgi:hypothetical protein
MDTYGLNPEVFPEGRNNISQDFLADLARKNFCHITLKKNDLFKNG